MIKVLDKDGLSLQEVLRQAQERRAQRRQQSDKSESNTDGGVDKVDVALSRSIQEQLDPEAILEERQQRFEEIKRLVQADKYQEPDPHKVAYATGEEITLEILREQEKGGV